MRATRVPARALARVPARIPARDHALDIVEILEQIFLNIKSRDILVNAQRVCKRWQETIKRSPKIQTGLFFRRSPKSLNREMYTKNHYVSYLWPTLFNATLVPYGVYPSHTRYGNMSLDEIRTVLHDYDAQGIWLANNASWRKMLVSQPPVTKIHWQVWREEQEDPRAALPGTIAEFNFPNGLRMGEYYDLILGTRCDHEITWPNLGDGCGRRDLRGEEGSPSGWEYSQVQKAYKQRAILIKQRVYDEPLKRFLLRERYWCPTNLHQYHRNLTALKGREIKIVGGRVTWDYKTRGTGQSSAMEIFLREAQDPVPPMAY